MSLPNAAAIDGRLILDQAREQADQGDYEAAATLYSRLVGNGDPLLHIAGLLGLADSRYRLDDEEGALQAWIVATQGPETPLTWQAWVQLAGARVRQGDLAGATRSYREAERRAPEHERAQISSRLGWLNKEMGNQGTAERYFGRARAGGFVPRVTWTILAVTVATMIWTSITPTGALVYDFLLLDKQAILQNGEYWRLFTVTLVHSRELILHIVFNMYALFIVGPIVEALYGRLLFVAFYLLAAGTGSVASYLFFPNPSVGASGAVFGLFGLLLVANWVHKPALGRQARALTSQIGILIVINLAIGFGVGRIDNAAHIGGLLAGAWIGFAIIPRGAATLASFWQRPATIEGQPTPGLSRLLRPAALLLVAVVIIVGVNLTPMWA